MKTLGADGLRDFDAERIFQRNFFLNTVGAMHEDDDETILRLHNPQLVAHLGTGAMSERIAELKKLKTAAAVYTKKLLNHEFKLERFGRRCSNGARRQRAEQLQQRYLARIAAVGELQSQISRLVVDGQKALRRQFNVELGIRLRRTRETLGLSRQELALPLGLSVQSIQKYENGEREMSPWTLAQIAEILGRTPNWFFGFTV